MCRNIRNLYNFEPPTSEDEIRDAARQYVRKVSGMQKPSHANEAAFERAVASEPIAKVGTLKISGGVAELSPDDTASDLFERADEDLYRAKAAAKQSGRAG